MSTATRLSALDASFLAVETPTAHMHVGWVAEFIAPDGRRAPGFCELRDHIGRRIAQAPRYRQMLAQVPLGVHPPEWVDDQDFDVDRHVYWAPGPVQETVAEIMSLPLRRDRPLWEMWIVEDDGGHNGGGDGDGHGGGGVGHGGGGVGHGGGGGNGGGGGGNEGHHGHAAGKRVWIVGKAHHCMVDGIAAVQLGSLLLDPTPDCPTEAGEPQGWQTDTPLSRSQLLGRAVRDLAGQQVALARGSLSAVRSPVRAARQTAEGALRGMRALGRTLGAAPSSPLNRQLSPERRLDWLERPLNDLKAIKQAYGTTVNDVMLAAVAGAMRSFMLRAGEQPTPLKAMVPVNVRSPDELLGNRISFVFVELPCDEPYPLKRLHRTHTSMTQRKRTGEPWGTDLALKAAARTPPPVQHAISRMVASPRTFNLVVSNIPGPPLLYMMGCRLRCVYPIVPLSDQHALSVGMTTVGDRACFGIYADPNILPGSAALAGDIHREIGELLARTGG